MSSPMSIPERPTLAGMFHWVKDKLGFKTEPFYYADNGLSDSTLKSPPTSFLDSSHNKYNASVLFRDEPLEDEPHPWKKWKIGAAQRSVGADKAYNDFLRGLEVLGLQELTDAIAQDIKNMPKEDAKGILDKLVGPGDYPNPKKDLSDLAHWERLVQLRRDAPIRRAVFKSMYDRSAARLSQQTEPYDGNPRSDMTGPPIRRSTLKLLLRPVEPDFNYLKAFLMLFSTGTLLGAFMCPNRERSGWSLRPVPAPPVDYRTDGKIQMYPRNTIADTMIKDTCTVKDFKAKKCGEKETGYRIEWPYMQMTDKSVQFPAELQCKLSTGGDKDFTYDPYKRTLLPEYWSCEGDTIPFTYNGVDFHFATDWYRLSWTVTLDCMKSVADDWKNANKKSVAGDWTKVNTFNNDNTIKKKLEICFLNHPKWGDGACDCNPNNALFYLQDTTVNNVKKHQYFGCMFASPDATALIPRSYDSCLSAPGQKKLYGIHATQCDQLNPFGTCELDDEIANEKLKASNDASVPSRRTALLVFLIIKEVGPVGGAVAFLCLIVIMAVLLVPICSLAALYSSTLNKHEATKFKQGLWDAFEDIHGEVLVLLWNLTNGISSINLAINQLSRIAFGRAINASIVKDGIVKVAQIANILYTLAVIMLSELTLIDGSALYISIFTSALSIVIMIVQENFLLKLMSSYLKDLNENRLHKFEIALGLVKLMESFLTHDVEVNFVQHLYGDMRVRPLALDDYEEDPYGFEKKWSLYDADAQAEIDNFANATCRDVLCCGDIQNDEPTIYPFHPLIPSDLEKKFGHDNRFEMEGKEQKVAPARMLNMKPERGTQDGGAQDGGAQESGATMSGVLGYTQTPPPLQMVPVVVRGYPALSTPSFVAPDFVSSSMPIYGRPVAGNPLATMDPQYGDWQSISMRPLPQNTHLFQQHMA